MGEINGLPAVNEVAFFLRQNAPDTVSTLAENGVQYSELLRPGVVGGIGDTAESAAQEGLRVRAEILGAALRRGLEVAKQRTAAIESKLRQVRSLRFLSGVCSAVASSGAVGSVMLGKPTSTIVLSLVSLTSTISNVASSSLVLGAGKKESDLVEVLRAFARTTSYCELAEAYLEGLLRISGARTELTAALKEGNGRFHELNEALAKSKF